MEFTPVGSSHVFAPAAAAGGGGGEAERACGEVVEKEHMFDKVVTPSDVGKLNRLVIPKQHAEKYFPLDAASNEKGLLLSFEDRTGKPWRFRYSYWNSSQSYVMTKGWSRFVKEKRLDAGDTVSFGRGVGEAARGRLFIDWRRRPDVTIPSPHHRLPLPSVPFGPWAIGGGGGGRLLLPPPSSSHHQHVVAPYDAHHYHHRRHGAAGYDGYSSAVGPTRQVLFLRPQQPTVVLDSVPVRITAHAEPAAAPSLSSPSGSKRVRLFGVNLDCPSSGEVEGAMARMAPPPLQQLPSPPSSSSSSSGKARCSLNLDL